MRKLMITFAAATIALIGSPLAAKQCFDAKHKFTTCGGPNDVTTPKASTATVSASAIMCKDGTSSAAKTTRGACSNHGGVQSASSTTATHTTVPAAEPVPAVVTKTTKARATTTSVSTPATAGAVTAICNDGTTSTSTTHSGTCSHHKGVKSWTK